MEKEAAFLCSLLSLKRKREGCQNGGTPFTWASDKDLSSGFRARDKHTKIEEQRVASRLCPGPPGHRTNAPVTRTARVGKVMNKVPRSSEGDWSAQQKGHRSFDKGGDAPVGGWGEGFGTRVRFCQREKEGHILDRGASRSQGTEVKLCSWNTDEHIQLDLHSEPPSFTEI